MKELTENPQYLVISPCGSGRDSSEAANFSDPFKYWKATIRYAQSFLFSKLNKPNSFNFYSLGEVLQPSEHSHSPPPDPLQQLHILLVLGGPKPFLSRRNHRA